MSAATATPPPAIAASPSLLGPAPLLRIEGAALFTAAIAAYAQLGAGWWTFAGLLLVPDLGLLGYLAGPRVGATTYNLTHTLALPLLLGALALAAGSPTSGAVALIWIAHIGMDRAIGYGLKYPTNFRETHLQRLA